MVYYIRSPAQLGAYDGFAREGNRMKRKQVMAWLAVFGTSALVIGLFLIIVHLLILMAPLLLLAGLAALLASWVISKKGRP